MAKKSPGSILKAKGLIPREWNLRYLSPGQKSWVTKQTKKFSEVVRRPDEFTTIPTKTRKQKAQAKGAGLPVTNNRAVVKATKAKRNKDGTLSIEKSDSFEEVFPINADNFNEVMRHLHTVKLEKNQVWRVQIGGHYMNQSFRNLYELQHYLLNDMDFEDDDYSGVYIAIVLVTVKRAQYVKHAGKKS